MAAEGYTCPSAYSCIHTIVAHGAGQSFSEAASPDIVQTLADSPGGIPGNSRYEYETAAIRSTPEYLPSPCRQRSGSTSTFR